MRKWQVEKAPCRAEAWSIELITILLSLDAVWDPLPRLGPYRIIKQRTGIGVKALAKSYGA